MRRLLLAATLLGAGCGRPGDPAPAPQAPSLRFEPDVLALGPVPPGATVSAVATLANDGTSSVTVERLDTPCDCTTARLDLPATLEPGARLAIPVRLDLTRVESAGLAPGSGPGGAAVERDIVVIAGTVSARLRLSVEVSDALHVIPPQLDLGTIAFSEVARGSVDVLPGTATTAVRVLSARSSDARLRGSVRDGTGAAVDVAWGPFDGPAALVGQLVLATDHAEMPEVTVEVRVRAVDLVILRPARIDVDTASLTRPVTQAVVIRRADGRTLEILGVQVDTSRIDTWLRPPQRPDERIMEVVVAVPEPPKYVDSVVYIDTNVEGARRVSLPVRVKARGPG